MRYNYISIEGNIGAGKSTLTKMLSECWQTELILEEYEDNPFLSKFYKDPNKYAFQLEMHFLAGRYAQQKRAFQSMDLFRSRLISDYMLQKCFVFSANNLSEEEFSIYRNFYSIIERQFPRPELIVYLHRSAPILMDLIKKRGRDYEEKISLEYLNRIESSYFNVFKQLTKAKILYLDLTNRDFERDPFVFNKVCDVINSEHKIGIHRFKI